MQGARRPMLQSAALARKCRSTDLMDLEFIQRSIRGGCLAASPHPNDIGLDRDQRRAVGEIPSEAVNLTQELGTGSKGKLHQNSQRRLSAVAIGICRQNARTE
jgi:hypothetical protein